MSKNIYVHHFVCICVYDTVHHLYVTTGHVLWTGHLQQILIYGYINVKLMLMFGLVVSMKEHPLTAWFLWITAG